MLVALVAVVLAVMSLREEESFKPVSYTHLASWKWIPKEREKSLFDRRRNRNTSNVTACKRVKL